MSTNLPPINKQDSGAATKLFFDSYGQNPLEFAANEVEASIGFFQSRGFDRDASIVVSVSLLKQARADRTPIFQILDTLKTLTGLQLSALVGEILNNDRPASSTLGYRVTDNRQSNVARNIAA
jgi:hypothetical protein